MNRRLFAIILLLVGITFSINSAAVMFANDQTDLYTIDLNTGAPTLVGSTGVQVPLTEIEYDNNTGRLYGASGGGTSSIEELNPATGASISSTPHVFGALNGLEYVGSTLYGTFIPAGGGAAPSTLVTVDTTTGVLTTIGVTGFGPISGLAYDALSMTMFGVSAGNAAANLLGIDLTTGLATLIAPILNAAGAPLDRIGSIEFGPGGVLYAVTTGASANHPSELLSINTATGQSTTIGSTGLSLTGLTFQANGVVIMPEPTTLALMGFGVAGLAYRRRKS